MLSGERRKEDLLTVIAIRVEDMFANDDVEQCGTTYLSNSCEIKLNGCYTHCGSHVPCGALRDDQDHSGCY